MLESINMANVLMHLSRGHDDDRKETETEAHRVFECKTCNRQFSSFQALGGHRASHKKPRQLLSDDNNQTAVASKPKVHECPVCGLGFSVGQALGGHMRRHRTGGDGFGHDHGFVEKMKGGGGGRKRVLLLDLNLPPSSLDDEMDECRKLGGGTGMEFVDKAHMVDCFQ